MADSELRQRKQQDAGEPTKASKTKSGSKSKVRDEDAYSPWVDVLRVITFLFFASCGLSYWISNGESFFWGMKNKPNYMRQGPIYLTPEQLAAYDGKDPTKPVYVALNGTIFDVSVGRHIYGPGGSYNYFAGCDAARAFVTGCFAEDRTPDMRGVEDMFLPLDDPEIDAQYTAAELKELKAKELAVAQRQAHDALKHWVSFFGNSQKYHKVGYVKREKNWLEKQPRRKLCAAAQQGRTKRKSRYGGDE
ncbi:cytochrome b5-like heme steroid binding domain-containing [Trichoderma arundinaceum]|uniref:Cytochrome b5-like heme steroid binding domain-containing n=1 Tax=Trichoderma arundinaceum TaxID=490622 RepID=A0A395NZV6_TRIAR|nr:cytochrome b5-like heme steroid binding domain-containing [Trichoderma arundinaceum]